MDNGILKSVGSHVRKGEKIGLASSTGKLSDGRPSVTGVHLHFEIRDSSENSLAPCNYLDSCNVCQVV
jgi:murein DD-endopeptidase MepM/ murein hydrolase activator NlpD